MPSLHISYSNEAMKLPQWIPQGKLEMFVYISLKASSRLKAFLKAKSSKYISEIVMLTYYMHMFPISIEKIQFSDIRINNPKILNFWSSECLDS